MEIITRRTEQIETKRIENLMWVSVKLAQD